MVLQEILHFIWGAGKPFVQGFILGPQNSLNRPFVEIRAVYNDSLLSNRYTLTGYLVHSIITWYTVLIYLSVYSTECILFHTRETKLTHMKHLNLYKCTMCLDRLVDTVICTGKTCISAHFDSFTQFLDYSTNIMYFIFENSTQILRSVVKFTFWPTVHHT